MSTDNYQGRHRHSRKTAEVNDVLGSGNKQLSGMMTHARHLQKVDRSLAELLPPGFAPHVRVANIRDDKLILITPVAPIATRLRMQEGPLLTALQAEYPNEFQRLEIRVTPDMPAREP